MSAPTVGTVELSRCRSCETRFLPTDGPCPHCGGSDREALEAPALGKVLAGTELWAPAEGWAAPHRLLLVELAEGVRALVLVEGSLPGPGAIVVVRREGEVYRAGAEPRSPRAAPGRGEGEFPRAGGADPSFEPPR